MDDLSRQGLPLRDLGGTPLSDRHQAQSIMNSRAKVTLATFAAMSIAAIVIQRQIVTRSTEGAAPDRQHQAQDAPEAAASIVMDQRPQRQENRVPGAPTLRIIVEAESIPSRRRTEHAPGHLVVAFIGPDGALVSGHQLKLSDMRTAVEVPASATSASVVSLRFGDHDVEILDGSHVDNLGDQHIVRYRWPSTEWSLHLLDSSGQPVPASQVLLARNSTGVSYFPPEDARELSHLAGFADISIPEAVDGTYWIRGEHTAWGQVHWNTRAAQGHELVLPSSGSIRIVWKGCEPNTEARWIATCGVLAGSTRALWTASATDSVIQDLPAECIAIDWSGDSIQAGERQQLEVRAGIETEVHAPCDLRTGTVVIRAEGVATEFGTTRMDCIPIQPDWGTRQSIAPKYSAREGSSLTAQFEQVPEGPYLVRVGPAVFLRHMQPDKELHETVTLPPPSVRQILLVDVDGQAIENSAILSWTWLPEVCELPTNVYLPPSSSSLLQGPLVELQLGPGELRMTVSTRWGLQFGTLELGNGSQVLEFTIEPRSRFQIASHHPFPKQLLDGLLFESSEGSVIPRTELSFGVNSADSVHARRASITFPRTEIRRVLIPDPEVPTGGHWIAINASSGIIDITEFSFRADN